MQIDEVFYGKAGDFTVDSAKMLSEGKLIAVRTHTRFIHFPAHRHNFIEVLYVCQGFRSTADTESSGKYDLFAGNRKRRSEQDQPDDYGTDLSLSSGICSVCGDAGTQPVRKYDFHDHTGLHRTAVPHSNPYRTLCQTESAYACP